MRYCIYPMSNTRITNWVVFWYNINFTMVHLIQTCIPIPTKYFPQIVCIIDLGSCNKTGSRCFYMSIQIIQFEGRNRLLNILKLNKRRVEKIPYHLILIFLSANLCFKVTLHICQPFILFLRQGRNNSQDLIITDNFRHSV